MNQFAVLLFSGLLIPLVGSAFGGEQILDLTIENSTGKYEVTVTRGELGETLEIALVEPKARIVIAHYSNGGFAYAIPKYPKMDRLVTLWQPGVALTTAIFRLAPPSNQREVVFDDSSEIEPDFIGSSFDADFMLTYAGKHFLGNGPSWVPDTATIYRWDGTTYQRVKTVPYEQRFSAIAEADKFLSAR